MKSLFPNYLWNKNLIDDEGDKMNFIVVAYFTRKTFYEDYARALVESLKKYNLFYHIEGIENLGDWYKNTNYKPTFIKKMMVKFPNYNIVYVDCDAVFFGYPELFERIEDNIAVHLFDKSHFNKRSKGLEILSGTIFLRNTKETYELVERWEKRCKEKPRQWDQKSLEQILNGNFYNLPEGYCKIYNVRYPVKNPIIVHYQASRQVRKNKGKVLKSKLREPLPQVLSKSE